MVLGTLDGIHKGFVVESRTKMETGRKTRERRNVTQNVNLIVNWQAEEIHTFDPIPIRKSQLQDYRSD